jgi:alpha-ketoglutarate-dependent taurine dioxygenase
MAQTEEMDMTDRFIALTPRIAAKAAVPRREVLDPGFAGECLDALECYGVLVFPGIDFDDDELVAFSEHLGELMPFGAARPDGTRAPIYKITLDRRENPVGADYLKNTTGWHIDGLFEDAPPPRASILAARRLSATGGQTEFCNTYAAYEELPEEQRRRCEPLRLEHTLEASNRAMSPDAGSAEMEAWRQAQARRERAGRRGAKQHPLVWHHRSGRRSLVLGMTVDHVVGLPEAESRELIERLDAHTTRRENVYRHEWQPGDALMWDNRGVMHRVIPYDPDSGRLMHRTTLCGDEPIRGIEASTA